MGVNIIILMKQKIIEFVNTHYKGSLRFLKPKMFIEKLGSSLYETIVKNIAVYSPIGVKIFDITSPELKSDNHVKFSTEHLSSGVYFVQISTETGTTIIQVVKN